MGMAYFVCAKIPFETGSFVVMSIRGGICLVISKRFISASLLVINAANAAASSAFSEYELTNARRTPENEVAGLFCPGNSGSVVMPKSTPDFVKSEIFHGPVMIIAAFPSINEELQKSPVISADGTSRIFLRRFCR